MPITEGGASFLRLRHTFDGQEENVCFSVLFLEKTVACQVKAAGKGSTERARKTTQQKHNEPN